MHNDRLYFAPRLRELCAVVGSISKVARDLEINRQQFARYLNGSTFPRPPVLARIAAYFDVEVADLFAPPVATPGRPNHTFRALPALVDVLSRAGLSDPTEEDIEPGFYLLHKRSFRYAEKVFIGLVLITRDARGVLRFKRRTSRRYAEQMPGIRLENQFIGVFARHGEHLVMFDYATVAPALVVFAFMPSLHFDNRIKPGIHMMMGTVGQRRPLVSRIFLERVEGGCSAVLAAARRQGFYADADLPRRVRLLLDTPADNSSHQFGINE